MPQSFASVIIHVVFSTKDRQPWISPELEPELTHYFSSISITNGCSVLEAGYSDDHCHLLISISRTIKIADIVEILKSNSSSWIKTTNEELSSFTWQRGYSSFSVGHRDISSVASYIRNQRNHHKGVSFKEEYLGFLRRVGLNWDERYVWG